MTRRPPVLRRYSPFWYKPLHFTSPSKRPYNNLEVYKRQLTVCSFIPVSTCQVPEKVPEKVKFRTASHRPSLHGLEYQRQPSPWDNFIERLYGKTVSLQAESKLTLHNPYWIIKYADVPPHVHRRGFCKLIFTSLIQISTLIPFLWIWWHSLRWEWPRLGEPKCLYEEKLSHLSELPCLPRWDNSSQPSCLAISIIHINDLLNFTTTQGKVISPRVTQGAGGGGGSVVNKLAYRKGWKFLKKQLAKLGPPLRNSKKKIPIIKMFRSIDVVIEWF